MAPGGTPTRGSITTITNNQVVINASGVPRTFEVKDIVKITFGDDPDELRSAREKVLEEDYEGAQAALAKVDAAKIKSEGIRQDYDFYVALCMAKAALAEQGDKAKAASAMYRFFKENTNTYHHYEAAEVLGDLSVSLGKPDMASQFYGELGRAPWPDYQLKATILESQSMMASGKYAEALSRFEQVISSGLVTDEIVEQKMYATIGKA